MALVAALLTVAAVAWWSLRTEAPRLARSAARRAGASDAAPDGAKMVDAAAAGDSTDASVSLRPDRVDAKEPTPDAAESTSSGGAPSPSGTETITLHVRDAVTRAAITECEVFALATAPSHGCGAVEIELPTNALRVAAGASPLACSRPRAHGSFGELLLRAPGYALGRLRDGWRADEVRSVALEPACELIVDAEPEPGGEMITVWACRLDELRERLRLRLRAARGRRSSFEFVDGGDEQSSELERCIELVESATRASFLSAAESERVAATLRELGASVRPRVADRSGRARFTDLPAADWWIGVRSSRWHGSAGSHLSAVISTALDRPALLRLTRGTPETDESFDDAASEEPVRGGTVRFAAEWLEPGMPPLPERLIAESIAPRSREFRHSRGSASDLQPANHPCDRSFELEGLPAGPALAMFPEWGWTTRVELSEPGGPPLLIEVPPPCVVEVQAHAQGVPAVDADVGYAVVSESWSRMRGIARGGAELALESPLTLHLPRGELALWVRPVDGDRFGAPSYHDLRDPFTRLDVECRTHALARVSFRAKGADVLAEPGWMDGIEVVTRDTPFLSVEIECSNQTGEILLHVDGEGPATLRWHPVEAWLAPVELPLELVRGETRDAIVPLRERR